MPNRTIYIKEQHVAFWDSLDNKSLFISDAIDALDVRMEGEEKVARLRIKKPTPEYKNKVNWGA